MGINSFSAVQSIHSKKMLRKLVPFALASAAMASSDDISVVCNSDNTIDVDVKYDKKAEVLSFQYGDCTVDSTNHRINFTQKSDFGWSLKLDVDACNMNDKLRTLEYNQTATMRVGRKSGASELTLANFDIDSYCTYTASYKVKFDYGNVEAEAHTFQSDAGLINLTFALKSYKANNYSVEETHPTQAGETIYLGLSITNKGFDHAADISNSATGKVFAPESCTVKDETNSAEYTLFNQAGNCANDDVDLDIKYDQDMNMWQFSHTLFLLGNHRASTLGLECTVIVCDRQDASKCDAIVSKCNA